MRKILVTGINGFVGKYLLELLGDDFVIGITHDGDLESGGNRKFVNGNILDSGFLQDLLRSHKPDVIVHLAAIAHTHRKDSDQIFKINLTGTNNIYQSVANIKDEQDYNPKIIYISSAEVYGKTDRPDSIDESASLNPVNYYGTSKLAADRLSYQLSQSNQLHTVILRPFNHTGPGQMKGFFVPDMASQIVEIEKDAGLNEIMVGNLESIRDLSDVHDIARAYKCVIDREAAPGEVFNISSGRGIKMMDLLTKLLSFSSKQIEIKHDESRMRPSDNPITVGNNNKFKSHFGWEPQIPLEKTLEDTLNYWRNVDKDFKRE